MLQNKQNTGWKAQEDILEMRLEELTNIGMNEKAIWKAYNRVYGSAV